MAGNAPRLWVALFAIGMQMVSTPSAWAQGRGTGAASQQIVPDARSHGMGEAFTAIAEGPAATFWNPGALGFGRSSSTLELSPFSHHRLYSNIFYSANFVVQQHGFGFGGNFNYVNYGVSDFASAGTPESSEYTFHGGLGANVSDVLRPTWNAIPLRSGRYELNLDVGLGVVLNVFHVDFAPGVVIPFSGGRGTSADLDFGMLWVARVQPADSRNVHPGYVGIRFGGVVSKMFDRDIEYGEGNSDPLGRSFRFGLAGEAAGGGNSRWGHAVELRLALDVDGYFGALDSNPGYYFGTELELLNLVSARMGRIGSLDETVYGFGIGFEFPTHGGVRFDVATEVLDSHVYTVSGWTTF